MTDAIITVVISLKNNAAGLRETLDSLASQSARDGFCVLVIDSNSSDFPIDVVRAFRDRLRIEFHSAFDAGIYNSWNKALAHVKTPWLTFFGSGDTFCEGAADALIGAVANDPAYDIISSKTCNVFADGSTQIRGSRFDAVEFGRYFSINHSGTLYRRTIFDDYGNFDERYRSSGDYEFLLRVHSRMRFGYIDQVISNYLVGGISSSSTTPLRETYAVRKRYKTVGALENRLLYLRGLAGLYRTKYLR